MIDWIWHTTHDLAEPFMFSLLSVYALNYLECFRDRTVENKRVHYFMQLISAGGLICFAAASVHLMLEVSYDFVELPTAMNWVENALLLGSIISIVGCMLAVKFIIKELGDEKGD